MSRLADAYAPLMSKKPLNVDKANPLEPYDSIHLKWKKRSTRRPLHRTMSPNW